jgi:fibronectin type 3 domain-containing protein
MPNLAEWNLTWGGTAIDIALDAATDTNGNVYVAGACNGTSILVKFDSDGHQIWNRTVNGMRAAYSVAIGSPDCIVVAGAGKLGRFDGAGTLNWSISLSVDFDRMAVAVDKDTGSIYVARHDHWGFGIDNALITKYTQKGAMLWERSKPTRCANPINEIAICNSSSIYLLYKIESNNDLGFVKYDQLGAEELWITPIINNSFSFVNCSIATGKSGNIYLAGGAKVSGLGTKVHLVLAKYNSTGITQWIRVISEADNVTGSGIVVDNNDDVLVSGTTWSRGAGGADMLLAYFNSSGQQIWNQTWGGTGDDCGNSIAMDTNGSAYMAGSTTSFGAGQADMAIVKYIVQREPGVPLNVQAVPGNGHVNLTWGVPSEGRSPITGYNLYWSMDNITFFKLDIGPITAYKHENLTNGQSYYYKIAAVNIFGQGANSTTVMVTPGIPGQVTNLLAVAGNGHVNLSWSVPYEGGSPITGYTLYWTTDNTNFTRIDLGNAIIYQHSGLADGQAYQYKVAAVNAIGEGANSSEVSISTWGVPAQVMGIAATPGDQNISLSWDAPSDNGASIISYNIYRSLSVAGTYSLVDTSTTTGYNNTGLASGIMYHYKVSAVNIIGEGANSSVISIATWGVPAQVTGIIATPGPQHISLSWDAPADNDVSITGYNIYRALSVAGEYNLIGTSTTTEYDDTGLASGTRFHYKVAAVNTIGESANSTIISAITWYLPLTPSLTIITSTPTTSLVITLAWTHEQGDEYYIIYRNVHPFNPGTINSSFIISYTNATTISDIVTGAGTYWYAVVAVNASGQSEPSIPVKIVVIPPETDWAIIVIIGVGIAVAAAGISFPVIKRRLKVTKRSGKNTAYKA